MPLACVGPCVRVRVCSSSCVCVCVQRVHLCVCARAYQRAVARRVRRHRDERLRSLLLFSRSALPLAAGRRSIVPCVLPSVLTSSRAASAEGLCTVFVLWKAARLPFSLAARHSAGSRQASCRRRCEHRRAAIDAGWWLATSEAWEQSWEAADRESRACRRQCVGSHLGGDSERVRDESEPPRLLARAINFQRVV